MSETVAPEVATPAPSNPQDILTSNIKLVFHAIADVMPFRFEREAEIFHAAIDKIDKAVDQLFAPIDTIAAPAGVSDLQLEVDELKKMVTQLLAAQGVSVTTPPAVVETPASPVVETPAAIPTPDPVPIPAPIVTQGS